MNPDKMPDHEQWKRAHRLRSRQA